MQSEEIGPRDLERGTGGKLHTEKILKDFLSRRVFVIEKFGVELDAKQRPLYMLHRLNGAGFVGGCATETFGQRLHFVTMGVPDSYFLRQVLENALSSSFDGKKPPSRFAPS